MRIRVSLYFDDGRLVHEQNFFAVERSGTCGYSFNKLYPGYVNVPREHDIFLKGYKLSFDIEPAAK